MRCKNCGTNNDDNRYICENCGSPLYDEAEISEINDNDATMTFGAVNNGVQNQPDNKLPDNNNTNNNRPDDDYSKNAEKKSIIVIAVLAVILVAIIVSVVMVAQAKKGNNETTSSTTESTTVSTTANRVSNYITQPTTEPTTESTTKETTTESTTKQTTTELKAYSIKLISKGGGTVEGAGTYEDGSNVTIVATPDGDYEFDGWYSNGEKISSSTVYSFTATKSVSISAVFTEITTTDEDVEDLDGGLD